MQVIWSWDSKWCVSNKRFPAVLKQDIEVRDYLKRTFRDAHIDAVMVERGPHTMTVTILAAKPGMLIGRGGKGLDDIRKYMERHILAMQMKVKLNVKEVHNPSLSSRVVALSMASEIERRIPFRRVMKQTIERVMQAGAQGVKVCMSGRLNGAEIARTEKLAVGKIPLISFRSNVDFALEEAQTVYGKIGIKVWIYTGEIFGRKDRFQESAEASPRRSRRRISDERE